MNESEDTLLAQLGDALDKAIRNALAQSHRKHATEKFYAYILFTSPLLEYAVPSFNTEESLIRIAKDVDQRTELRWQPPDWEYHCEGEECFKSANDILGSLRANQGYDEPEVNKRWNVFLDVLKRLDIQGLFGIGADRESVLINVMWGDQDNVAHVESARELNPLSSYLQFARHQLPSLYRSEKEMERSRSMYKEQALTRIRGTIAKVEKDLRKSH